MRHVLPALIFVAITLTGCSHEKSHLPAISQTTAFHMEYREAALAISNSLSAANENPNEYHAETTLEPSGVICFHLWHQSAFSIKYRATIGNPGGKCRDVRYDTSTHKIVSSLLWK
jgi:hypothetical protein